MAANLCCTFQRPFTPTDPPAPRTIEAHTRLITAGPNGTSSRYTSTRSEDLREIQQLFDPENLNDAATAIHEEKSIDSSTVSSRQSKLATFFRRKLSRKFSLSKCTPSFELDRLKHAKNELRSNLLTDGGPDDGGYDADATVLSSVDEPSTPQQGQGEPVRGRSKARRYTIDNQDWSIPLHAGRLSLSLSPHRLSLGSRGAKRRSRSMSSIHEAFDTPATAAVRLPSFSVERDTSRNWKRGVMESLHINSPSNSTLVHTPSHNKKAYVPCLQQWPLRETLVTPVESDAPLIQSPRTVNSQAADIESTTVSSIRPSMDVNGNGDSTNGPTQSLPSRYGSVASSVRNHPHFFMRPERRPMRVSTASVHLYNMGISNRLRSESSLTTGLIASLPSTRLNTAVPTRSHSPMTSQAGVSTQVLDAAGTSSSRAHDAHVKDDASSHYSSPARSRSASHSHVEADHLDQKTETGTPQRSISAEPKFNPAAVPDSLPDNPSSSNLSEQSTKSSKVSKFKENFESSDVRRSKKRSSIVNLFTKTLRRKSASLDSLDGTLDEPRRLQRAFAITDCNDAAGLLAKAIRERQTEKSSMYLEGNKLSAQREVFRRRSSSYCRTRGDSNASKPEQDTTGSEPHDWHRRSTSDSCLRAGINSPLGVSNTSMPRAHSTGHLRPEFNTTVFSEPSGLSPQGSRPGSARSHSISVDPTASPAIVSSVDPRKPSFQLNDVPAVLEGPVSASTTKAIGSVSERQDQQDDSNDELDLGAWSRYPSHTREQRTGSAGAKDLVFARDFAYDQNTLSAVLEDVDEEEGGLFSKKRGKNKKKRVGKLPKSRSMTLGKELLKGYSRLFRSSSSDWLGTEKGHRSSISASGALEHPDLEILPPVFAPMPIIPDAREDDTTQDPALAPDAKEIALKQLKHRRADHGNSFVDGFADVSNGERVTAMDPKMETSSSHDLHDAPRRDEVLSSSHYSTDGYVTANDNENAISSAFNLSDTTRYESCVFLPGTVGSSASRFTSATQTTEYHSIDLNGDINALSPNSIDKMLASQTSSANISPIHSPIASPLMVPVQNITGGHAHARRGHSHSIGSVASLRASSVNLLKTLKEAEERERQLALEGLLSKARISTSEERKETGEMSVAEGKRPMTGEYKISNRPDYKSTWPGAFRGTGAAVEAN